MRYFTCVGVVGLLDNIQSAKILWRSDLVPMIAVHYSPNPQAGLLSRLRVNTSRGCRLEKWVRSPTSGVGIIPSLLHPSESPSCNMSLSQIPYFSSIVISKHFRNTPPHWQHYRTHKGKLSFSATAIDSATWRSWGA